MQRLENVSPDEMPEVVRVASELYESDRSAEEKRTEAADYARAAANAAEELGLPSEYLERAAEVVQHRRIERVKRARRTRRRFFAIAGAAMLLWGGWIVTHPAPPKPAAYSTISAPQHPWRLETNPESRAHVMLDSTTGREAALITVESFGRASNGAYWVNYNSAFRPVSLAGQKRVSFAVEGKGLRSVRLYLENGPRERWRSPPVTVGSEVKTHYLPLSSFDHQVRNSSAEAWKTVDYSAPGEVQRFSFKLGDYVNDLRATGEVTISDLRFDADE